MADGDHSDQRHPIDIHVGLRLREIRRIKGVSQTVLADALALTFQQVQKYEKGVNRLSASKLFDAAMALDVPIELFFRGLPSPMERHSAATPLESAAPLAPEGREIDALLATMPPAKRRLVRDLADALARAEPSE